MSIYLKKCGNTMCIKNNKKYKRIGCTFFKDLTQCKIYRMLYKINRSGTYINRLNK
jgi:hypothetical protein